MTDQTAVIDESSVSETTADLDLTAEDQEAVAFKRNFDRSDFGVSWKEFCVAFGVLSFWFVLFTGGTLLSTSPAIEALSAPSSALHWFGAAATVLLFWTITNVGLLAITAAILGAFGQRTHFASILDEDTPSQPVTAEFSQRGIYNHYASSVMRGFGVYVLVLSGLLALATNALTNPDQGQYVRLAGLISVVSFYAGYDPRMLAGLLRRIENLMTP